MKNKDIILIKSRQMGMSLYLTNYINKYHDEKKEKREERLRKLNRIFNGM